MQVLLELGADPRVTADDGATPEQVCTSFVKILLLLNGAHCYGIKFNFGGDLFG